MQETANDSGRQDKQNKKKSHHTYRKLKKVGNGNFGTVYLAQSEMDRKLYIIKILKNERSLEQKENILREVKVMKSLRHQYVIAYRQSFVEKNKICIVMEYAENGDLAARIQEQKKTGNPFDQDQILEWFIQICFGLKYIHEKKIVHRDLKCQNILLTANNECKIGDFGISKIMEETFDLARTKIGTPYNMAPEIWQDLPYNQKSDIWSLGCVLYELCTLKSPFAGSNAGSILVKITQGKIEPIKGNFSDDLKELVTELLSKEPQLRPSVHKILQKEFIKKRISTILSKTLGRYDGTLNEKQFARSNCLIKSNPPLQHNRSLSYSIKGIDDRQKIQKLSLQLAEYKQNYPLVLSQNKAVKEQLKMVEDRRDQLEERIGELLREVENPDLSAKDLRKLLLEKLGSII